MNVEPLTPERFDKPARRVGLAAALLDAAVAHACVRGAIAVEGYGHAADASDYMGSRALFLAHGFRPARDASKRVIVRRECG